MTSDPSPLQTAEVVVADVPAITPAVCQNIIAKISKLTDDAFYLMNANDVIAKYNHWRRQLPHVQPFYAVKCNNHPLVLQLLNALGCNFDCGSKKEIQTVLDMGVDPERIIFANSYKLTSHIRMAEARGVRLMTFDNATELHKIKQLSPTARLVLRIRVDVDQVQGPMGDQFGAEPTAVGQLLKLCKQLQLQLVGVSFHVGSSCREPEAFGRAIAAAADVFAAVDSLGLPSLELLDLGGGFLGETVEQLDTSAQHIRQALYKYFPQGCGVRVIAEPGRYMVQSAFTLATQVVSVIRLATQPSHSQQDGGRLSLYVNDGVYGAFNCLLYGHQVCTPCALYDVGNTPSVVATVFGPTRNSLDCICSETSLPMSGATPGDWLLWRDMGAYTLSTGTVSDGCPPRAVVHAVVTAAQLCDGLRSVFGQPAQLPSLFEVAPPSPGVILVSPESCCVVEN